MKKLLIVALLASSAAFGQSMNGKLVFSDPSFYLQATTDFYSKGNKHAICGLSYSSDFLTQYPWISVFEDQEIVWSKKMVLNDLLSNMSVQLLNNSADAIVCMEGVNNASGRYFYILTRLNYETGEEVWSKHMQFDQNSNGNYTYLDAVKITAQDEIIVTNSMNDFLYAAKFSSSGDVLFSKKINNINEGYGKNPGFSFAQTSDGGYIGTLKNESNPTLIKLNADLSTAWTKLWSVEGYSHPRTTLELSNGKYAVAGLGDAGCFVAILNQNGELEKYRTFSTHSGGYGLDYIQEINQDEFFAAGYGFCATINMTTGWVVEYSNLSSPQPYSFSNSGGINLYESYQSSNEANTVSFTTLFDPEESVCSPFESYQFMSTNVTLSQNQETNTPFYVVNTGQFSTYTLITEPLNASISSGCFLTVDETVQSSFALYPNPVSAGNALSIQLEKAPTPGDQLLMTDLSGKIVQTIQLSGTNVEMGIQDLSQGIYFMNYVDQNKRTITSQKVIVN